MPASFILTLDTLGPAITGFAVSGAAPLERTIDVQTDAPDVAQVKLWGPSVVGAPDEASAAWQTYNPAGHTVEFVGDGMQTVFARLRDDVWNEGAADQTAVALDAEAPVVTVTTVDPGKISTVPGKDVSTVVFSVDDEISEWEIRVVADDAEPHTAGTLVKSAAAVVAANTPIETTVTGAELDAATPNDGDYTLKVFALDDGGNWSL